jgi:hypothetical protein
MHTRNCLILRSSEYLISTHLCSVVSDAVANMTVDVCQKLIRLNNYVDDENVVTARLACSQIS